MLRLADIWDGTCMNFASSDGRPTLLQKSSLSNIVAVIIRILLHFSDTRLQ